MFPAGRDFGQITQKKAQKSPPAFWYISYIQQLTDIASHLRIEDHMYIKLQRTNAENLKQIFPEKELCGHRPNFHIHVFVSDLYIFTIYLPIPRQENMWTHRRNIDHRYINVEIVTKATQFSEKEYINGIFVAV